MKNNPSPTTMKECKCHCHRGHLKDHGFNYNNCAGEYCEHCTNLSQPSEEKHGTELSVPWEEKGVEGWAERVEKILSPKRKWIEFANINNYSMEMTRDLIDSYDKTVDEIVKQIQEARREERERIMELIHKRKVEWYKDCLNDQFINGRFWEAQELWELLKNQ